jgi:hypothetical protein
MKLVMTKKHIQMLHMKMNPHTVISNVMLALNMKLQDIASKKKLQDIASKKKLQDIAFKKKLMFQILKQININRKQNPEAQPNQL